jgi:hypothetical protein
VRIVSGGRAKKTKAVAIAAMVVAVAVPPLIATAVGQAALAGSLVLPVIATLLPALLIGPRTALFATAVVTVGSAAAALTSGDPILGGVVMGLTSLVAALACHWGHSKLLVLVPMTVGFLVCATPLPSGDRGANALLIGGATLAAALWGAAVGALLRRDTPQATPNMENWRRTWSYAIVLALLTGIAATISVYYDLAHAGGWFILTVVIVFQPYLQDSFQRTWQRAGGTVLGVIVAYLLHIVVPWATVEVILGAVLMVTAITVISEHKYPYWFFTTLLTPAIVLLAGASTNFDSVAAARLFATLAGAALAFAAAALLAPLYSASAKKHGHTRF